MKIALITKQVSYSHGGAEMVSVNLAERLTAAGHDVHIFTRGRGSAIAGARVHEIKTIRWLSPLRLVSFQRNARKRLEKEKFDLIYSLCQVYPVDIYRVGDGIHRHWMRLQYPKALVRTVKYLTSQVHLAMRCLEDRIFAGNNCRYFITNSSLVRGQILKYFGIKDNRIRVIYNGTDHETFNPGVAMRYRKTMRERCGIAEDELVLLHVSNNWKRKGLSTIIRAIPGTGIERLRIVVVGRGRPRKYKGLMRRENIEPGKIIFAGPAEDIEKYYGMADVFVLPTRYEPFSNACLEAMACGLPVVTTATNGASEIIRHGENGYILGEWDDSEGLAEIIRALADKRLREKIGNNASETAKKFTWERHVRETNEVFELVVRKKFERSLHPPGITPPSPPPRNHNSPFPLLS